MLLTWGKNHVKHWDEQQEHGWAVETLWASWAGGTVAEITEPSELQEEWGGGAGQVRGFDEFQQL